MGADVAAAVADSLEGGRVQDGRAAAWDAGRGGLTCWPVMALAAAAAGGVQLRVPGAACVCKHMGYLFKHQTEPLHACANTAAHSRWGEVQRGARRVGERGSQAGGICPTFPTPCIWAHDGFVCQVWAAKGAVRVLRLYLAGASAADRADLRLVGVVRVGLRGGRVRMRVWVWVRVRALPAVVRDGTGQCCFKLHELGRQRGRSKRTGKGEHMSVCVYVRCVRCVHMWV
eukprot:1157723-Pelagomonas_calceolata.AAC.8